MGLCHHQGPSNKRHLTSLDLKAKVVRLADGWQVNGRSTSAIHLADFLDCLLSQLSDIRSASPTDSNTSPPPSPTSVGSDELELNTTDLGVDVIELINVSILLGISGRLRSPKICTCHTNQLNIVTKGNKILNNLLNVIL